MTSKPSQLRSELMGLDKSDSEARTDQLALRCLILGSQTPLFFDPTRPESVKLYRAEERLRDMRQTFEISADERLLRILAREIPRLASRLTNESDGWLISHAASN